ncbi:MAG: hypothetical protein K1X75_12520 [Leptospirales bacterium]|nr:hypothetical protein [Leptospirales bacterium]
MRKKKRPAAKKLTGAERPGIGRPPQLLRFETATERPMQATRRAGPALLREALWKVEALRKELRGMGKEENQ